MGKTETVKEKSIARHLGLDDARADEAASLLVTLLADVNVLFVKTLNYHWNIEDPRFFFLHELLDEQYKALLEDQDEIAERIRKIGRPVPASLQEFKENTRLKEILEPLSADEMLRDLVLNYELLIRVMRSDIARTTDMEDFGTADMITQLIGEFEKRAWMLRSHLVQ